MLLTEPQHSPSVQHVPPLGARSPAKGPGRSEVVD